MSVLVIIAIILGYFIIGVMVCGFATRVFEYDGFGDDPTPFFIALIWPVSLPVMLLFFTLGKYVGGAIKWLYELCWKGNPWQSWKSYVSRKST